MKSVVRVLVGAALMALLAAPAAAQNSALGVGFVSQNQSWNGCCATGFAVDFAQTISKKETTALAIVVDFTRTKFSDDFGFEETNNIILGGVRYTFLKTSRVSVFGQATAGVMSWKDNDPKEGTDVIVGGGGGVQIRLTDMIDVKAQVDIYADRFADEFGVEWFRYTRLLLGAVFKFGAK